MGKMNEWGGTAADWVKSLTPGTVFTSYDLLKYLRENGYPEVTEKNVASWIIRRIQTSRFSTNPQYGDMGGIQSTGHQFEYRWMPGEESYGLHQRSAMVKAQAVERQAQAAAAKREAEVKAANDWVASTRAKPVQPVVQTHVVDVPAEHVPVPVPVTHNPGLTILNVTPEGILIVQDSNGEVGLYQKVVVPQRAGTFLVQ